jgi:hypothetical protein
MIKSNKPNILESCNELGFNESLLSKNRDLNIFNNTYYFDIRYSMFDVSFAGLRCASARYLIFPNFDIHYSMFDVRYLISTSLDFDIHYSMFDISFAGLRCASARYLTSPYPYFDIRYSMFDIRYLIFPNFDIHYSMFDISFAGLRCASARYLISPYPYFDIIYNFKGKKNGYTCSGPRLHELHNT